MSLFAPGAPLPGAFFHAAGRQGIRLARDVLWVQARSQRMGWFRLSGSPGKASAACGISSHRRARPGYRLVRWYLISTSRLGLGQEAGSNCTPLGLHRVAERVGGGWPMGAVFESRKLAGFTWQGWPDAAIAHRILWLEGLEPGWNRGAGVDSRDRYIYIHGVGDETTLGRPASRGCIHVAARDLMPLFDGLSPGALVWIEAT
jgi:hypothetical protein